MVAQPPCTWALRTSGLHPQEPAPPPGSQAAHGVNPSLEATQVPAVPTAREGGDTRPRSWGTVETGDSRCEVSCCHLWEYCLQSLRTWNWELIKGGEEAGTSLAAFGAGRTVCPGLLGPACPAQVGSGTSQRPGQVMVEPWLQGTGWTPHTSPCGGHRVLSNCSTPRKSETSLLAQ